MKPDEIKPGCYYTDGHIIAKVKSIGIPPRKMVLFTWDSGEKEKEHGQAWLSFFASWAIREVRGVGE